MSVSITLKRPAYERLKKLKEPGDSFSDVVMRELPERIDTLGDMLDYWDTHEMPKSNPKLEAKMLSGRGRRSNRRKL